MIQKGRTRINPFSDSNEIRTHNHLVHNIQSTHFLRESIPLSKYWFRAFSYGTNRSSRLHVSFKIGVFKNFANFSRKHLCWSLFLITLKAFWPKFSKISEIFKNTFICIFTDHLCLLLPHKAAIYDKRLFIRFWTVELDLENWLKLFLSNPCKVTKSRISFGCYRLCFIWANDFWATKSRRLILHRNVLLLVFHFSVSKYGHLDFEKCCWILKFHPKKYRTLFVLAVNCAIVSMH